MQRVGVLSVKLKYQGFKQFKRMTHQGTAWHLLKLDGARSHGTLPTWRGQCHRFAHSGTQMTFTYATVGSLSVKLKIKGSIDSRAWRIKAPHDIWSTWVKSHFQSFQCDNRMKGLFANTLPLGITRSSTWSLPETDYVGAYLHTKWRSFFMFSWRK